MGRRLKTFLPTKADLLKPRRSQEIQHHFQKRKERENSNYHQHSGKELPPVTPGDKMYMHHENEWIQATAVNKHHTPRSHIVQTPNGKSTEGIVVIFAWEFLKQRTKGLMQHRSHNLKKPLLLLQLVSKADLADQEQLRIMVRQQKFVLGQVGWSSNPNTWKTMNGELLWTVKLRMLKMNSFALHV